MSVEACHEYYTTGFAIRFRIPPKLLYSRSSYLKPYAEFSHRSIICRLCVM